MAGSQQHPPLGSDRAQSRAALYGSKIYQLLKTLEKVTTHFIAKMNPPLAGGVSNLHPITPELAQLAHDHKAHAEAKLGQSFSTFEPVEYAQQVRDQIFRSFSSNSSGTFRTIFLVSTLQQPLRESVRTQTFALLVRFSPSFEGQTQAFLRFDRVCVSPHFLLVSI